MKGEAYLMSGSRYVIKAAAMTRIFNFLETLVKHVTSKRRSYKACLYIALMVVMLIGTAAFHTKKSLYVEIADDEEFNDENGVIPSQVGS